MATKSEIGVQSWCFREFKSNEALIGKLKELGLTRVEFCGIHVDFGKPETFESVLAAYRTAGIKADGVGVTCITENKSASENVFRFAKLAGCSMVSVDFPMKNHQAAFRVAEELAEKYGVNVGIHNHGGGHWLGSKTALEYVFGLTSERVGLCLDTAWALDARQDPINLAKAFRMRLYGLHVKDFVFDSKGKEKDVVVGTGNLDLPQLMGFLGETDYAAALTIEYEGEPQNPSPAIRKCVEEIRKNLDM